MWSDLTFGPTFKFKRGNPNLKVLIACLLLYPQTKVGDTFDSGPSRRRRYRLCRNFLVYTITQQEESARERALCQLTECF